jgi:flagellar hook-associated protein 2
MQGMLEGYNADSSKGYEPLTSDEKAAMTETEIDDWEKKIKDSLLRRDETLGSTISAMHEIMNSGIEMKDGSTMYLFDFGINNPGYFNAEENFRNSFHIDGDKDDTVSSKKEDKLMAAINADPDKVANFFQELTEKLYSKLTDLMGSSDYSSAYTLYNDKQMKTDYTDYTSRIAKAEADLNAKMDKYYQKFAAMESAMAQLQNQQNSFTSMLG